MSNSMRKQKYYEASKDPAAIFHPKSLPILVWDEIFRCLSDKELLNLSLVCKTSYELIGNSFVAMDKISLRLDNEMTAREIELFLNSARTYTNVQIMGAEDVKGLTTILEKYGPKITDLVLMSCELNQDDFVEIFKLTQNVKSLILTLLQSNNKSSAKEVNYESFKLAKLETLKVVNSDTSKILIFLPETIRKIMFFCCFNQIFASTGYPRILEKQKDLKFLHLNSMDGTDPGLNIIDDSKVKFQLETLEIMVSRAALIKTGEQFSKFLKSQSGSLKTLRLMNMSLHEYHPALESLKKLETLEVYSRKVHQLPSADNFKCPSVQNLVFRFPYRPKTSIFSSFIKQFPNVKEIVILKRLKSTLLKILAENLPNLKKLTISEFCDRSFENVTLGNIRELIIDGRGVLTKMTHTLEAVKNVEVLKIRKGLIINCKTLFILLENYKSLTHLEVDKGMQLRELCENVQFFKNLKFLKIFYVFPTQSVEDLRVSLKQFTGLNSCLSYEKVAAYKEDFLGKHFDETCDRSRFKAFNFLFNDDDDEEEEESEDDGPSDDDSVHGKCHNFNYFTDASDEDF